MEHGPGLDPPEVLFLECQCGHSEEDHGTQKEDVEKDEHYDDGCNICKCLMFQESVADEPEYNNDD